MKKSRYLPFIIIALLLLPVTNISAKSSSSAMIVAIRVLPALSKSIHYKSPTLNITADDIKKGYVEIKDAAVLNVSTNSRQGYMISLEQTALGFKEIWISDGSRTVIFQGSSGIIHQTSSKLNTLETKKLSFRFILSNGIRPGTYRWPVLVNVLI